MPMAAQSRKNATPRPEYGPGVTPFSLFFSQPLSPVFFIQSAFHEMLSAEGNVFIIGT